MELFKQILWKVTRPVLFCSLVCLFAWPVLPVQAQAVVFVTPAGTGDCSQASPCNLADGLSLVDSGGTLYAAEGMYTGTGNQVVWINKTINLLGGWNGAIDGSPIRDPQIHESILDGQNVRRVISISLDTPGSMTVDGWTIRNGNATGLVDGCSAENAAGCGGGLQVITGLVTIEHCIIEENIAATTSVTGAITGYGGGIYLQNPSNMTIRYNLIRNNSASVAASGPTGSRGVGGGIYASGAYSEANLTISDNEFYGNETAPAGQTGYGAGMAFYNSHGLVTRNYVHNNDPGSSARGSGLALEQSDLTITRNYFMNNQGMDALYLKDFIGHLDSNIIINPLSNDGVHIHANDWPRQSVVSNNIIAQHWVANVRVSGEYTRSANTYLYQNTLDDARYGLSVESFSTVHVSNSIISNHSIWDVYFGGTMMSINISYTLFFNNEENGSWPFLSHPIPSGDPRYVNAAGGNYHILPDSAARDVAESTGISSDFDGESRPMGSGTTPYDVGADEFWWKSSLPMIFKP